jgi:hypothetical protein
MLPDELHERIRAFQESRTILTALELDVFSAAADGHCRGCSSPRWHRLPRHGDAAPRAHGHEPAHEQQGLFRCTPETARFFTAASPQNARLALLHIAHLWHTWSHLTDAVRTGSAVRHEEMASRGEDWTEAFIAAMHSNATERAPHATRAIGLEGVRRMLDVGGGSGAYSSAFAKASPALTVDILDLASVVPIAQRHILQAGVADRVSGASAIFAPIP